MPPGGGNIGVNHQEIEEVRAELNRRKSKKPEPAVNDRYFVMTDRNENRLFKPLLSANRYVHEDDHIEWLIGRTRAVQSKLSWAKVA